MRRIAVVLIGIGLVILGGLWIFKDIYGENIAGAAEDIAVNMVAIKSVFTFEKPDKAPAASIQPVKYNAVREIIAVSHIGILFSM